MVVFHSLLFLFSSSFLTEPPEPPRTEPFLETFVFLFFPATYIDPKMRKSTDFKFWLDKPATQEKLKGKQVLLYCTGGVRCERASALVNHKIGGDIQGVYQLYGGVEKYMQEFPGTFLFFFMSLMISEIIVILLFIRFPRDSHVIPT